MVVDGEGSALAGEELARANLPWKTVCTACAAKAESALNTAKPYLSYDAQYLPLPPQQIRHHNCSGCGTVIMWKRYEPEPYWGYCEDCRCKLCDSKKTEGDYCKTCWSEKILCKYELYISGRRSPSGGAGGLHAEGVFKSEREAITALMKRARELLSFFDSVSCRIFRCDHGDINLVHSEEIFREEIFR
jgi:hypothetical protein